MTPMTTNNCWMEGLDVYQTLDNCLDEWTTIDKLCSVTDQLTDEEIISGAPCHVPTDANPDTQQNTETPPAITSRSGCSA